MLYKNKKAFTFIELFFSMSLLIIISPIIYGFLVDFSNKIYLSEIRTKSMANIVNAQNIVSGVIENSYGVKYSDINTGGNLDTITLYTDKLEKNSISVYVKQDLEYDISRLYINKQGIEYPLHSTELFIESFDIETSPQPIGSSLDIQPWVSINISARTRSPLEIPTEDKFYDMYNKSEISLYGGKRIIRNYVPTSGKN